MKTITSKIEETIIKNVEYNVEFPLYLKSKDGDIIKISENEAGKTFPFQSISIRGNSFFSIGEKEIDIAKFLNECTPATEYDFINAIAKLRDSVIELMPITKEIAL